jgi:hypothetical protein
MINQEMTALVSLYATIFVCRFMNFTLKLKNKDNMFLILQIKEVKDTGMKAMSSIDHTLRVGFKYDV